MCALFLVFTRLCISFIFDMVGKVLTARYDSPEVTTFVALYVWCVQRVPATQTRVCFWCRRVPMSANCEPCPILQPHFMCFCLKSLSCYRKITPQWEAVDTEIKVSFDENTELKGSPFKAGSRSVYSHAC